MKKLLAIALVALMVISVVPLTVLGADLVVIPEKFNAPENVSVEYERNISSMPSVKVTYDKDEALNRFIEQVDSSPENIRVYYFNSPMAQIDWSLGSDTDWHYSKCWDRSERKNESGDWEYFTYLNTDTRDETRLFEISCLEDSDWSDEESGFRNVIKENQYYIARTEDSYNYIDFDYNTYPLYVRVRYIFNYYETWEDYERDNMTAVTSDWSDTVRFGGFREDYPENNLLVNPDFEKGLSGWTDKDGVWETVFDVTGDYFPVHGRYFTWPVRGIEKNLEKTNIYQDISLDGYEAGETVVLNALLCNYDQPPHDMGRIQLTFFNKDGKSIKTYTQEQRNPNWNSQTIIAPIPKNAAKLRVTLWAYLYVGGDIDAYYDYAKLYITKDTIHPVSITEKNGKETIKSGDKLSLTAFNGESKNPSDYLWASSHDIEAVIDENGVVTALSDCENGIAFYATDKVSGVTGVYWVNSDIENITTDDTWLPADNGIHTGEDHSVSHKSDASSHWLECSTCAVKSTKESHKNSNIVTKATLSMNGSVRTICSVCSRVSKTTSVAYPKTFSLSATKYTYDGKARKPSVTVKDSGGKVVDPKNYTVSYSANTNVGTAKVTIAFKGNYSGTKTLNFTITPEQVTGLKASTVKKDSIKLTWAKVTGAKYYKVEQSTDGKKWTTVNAAAITNSITVSKLKAGTKYQFRVTALDSTKKISGKTSAVLKTGTLTASPAVTLKSSKSKTAVAGWKKVTGASKYVVYKSTDGKKWTKVTTTTKLTYTLTKLTGGKKIYVKVTGINAYGKESAAGSVKNVTVKK